MIATNWAGPSVLDGTDEAILESLARNQELATRKFAFSIGLSPRAACTRLSKLVGRGLVREIVIWLQDSKPEHFLAER